MTILRKIIIYIPYSFGPFLTESLSYQEMLNIGVDELPDV